MSCTDCKSSLEPFRDFWDRVSEKRIPVSATLELTPRCNFACVHCYCVVDPARKPQELSTDEWKDVLEQLADAGGITATLTGGDPFVRPDFFEIAEYARARRFALRLLTNASFVTERNADRVAALKPLQVSISLYGATRATYEAVTGRADFFDRAVAGIDRLHARGVPMELKFPLLRENFAERHDMIRFAERRGLRWREEVEITPKDDGDRSPLAHALDDDDLATYVRELKGPLEPREKFDPADQLCRPGVFSLVVGPYGDIYPCMQIKKSMGNLREQPFVEIWEHSELLNRVRGLRAGDFETCNECGHFGACKPCPGISVVTTGELTAATETTCRVTEARARLNVVNSDRSSGTSI